MKISVCITTFNSKDFIEDCLKSVRFADEIIVVDHGSVDGTQEIIKKYTKNIFAQKNNPAKIDVQKNFGFQQASHDWILSLDADERVPLELASEIKAILANDKRLTTNDQDVVGYRIPRKNIIFGKWIQHSLWWPDFQLRLFRKGKGEYKDGVHKDLDLQGECGELKSPILHENYQSVSQYLVKMDSYTQIEANTLIKSDKKLHFTDALRFPLQDFLKTFFLQNGYKDGLHGLVLSVMQAFYSFLVFAKVWEQQGFKEENSDDFLRTIHKEWMRAQKEISYWFLTAFITRTKNPIRKIRLSIQRKVKSS